VGVRSLGAAGLLLALSACGRQSAPAAPAASSAPANPPASVQPSVAPSANAPASAAPKPAPSRATNVQSSAPTAASAKPAGEVRLQEFPVPKGEHPHDVAPTSDGMVWYTAQVTGEAGKLDPATGQSTQIKLGQGSAPHGIIVGPDKGLWITDGGLNAIVRVDPATEEVRRFPLPEGQKRADLNTPTFDARGRLWFTGQNGIYGRLDPASGKVDVFDAPKGRGPYGMTTTKDGGIFYASLAGSYVGRIDPDTGKASLLEPPTPSQGSRRVWADSRGHRVPIPQRACRGAPDRRPAGRGLGCRIGHGQTGGRPLPGRGTFALGS
jgi:streptogramin lyase